VDQVPGFGAAQGAVFFFVPLQKKFEQFRVIFQAVGFDHFAESEAIMFQAVPSVALILDFGLKPLRPPLKTRTFTTSSPIAGQGALSPLLFSKE